MGLSVACRPFSVAGHLGLNRIFCTRCLLFDYLCGFFFVSNIKMGLSDPESIVNPIPVPGKKNVLLV
jgi:hypothetical protein